MDTLPRYYARLSQVQAQAPSKRRSGYEPSDVETDLDDKSEAYYVAEHKPNLDPEMQRNKSPSNHQRSSTSKFESDDGLSSKLSRRNNNNSPFKTRRDVDDNGNNVTPRRRNISPLSKSERRDHVHAGALMSNHRNFSPFSRSRRTRHVSPYKSGREKLNLVNNETAATSRRQDNSRTPTRGDGTNHSQFQEAGRTIDKPNFASRSVTAPRQRGDQRRLSPPPMSRNMVRKPMEHMKSPSPPLHVKSPSVGEINEMIANAKISRNSTTKAPFLDSTESFSHGDIFSHDASAMPIQKHVLPQKNSGFDPNPPIHPDKESLTLHQQVRVNGSSHTTGFSRTTITSSRKINSKQLHKHTTESDTSRTVSTITLERFTSNIKKSEGNGWFSCMKKGSSCSKSKSPTKRIDESNFIKKAPVIKQIRPFWADKYQPGSLNGFTCHKQEAQLLKQIASEDNLPHILLKGPPGSGKRSLALAFLREIYGDACYNVSHELRSFQVQEKRAMQVVLPLTSSMHHFELNVKLEANAKYALMGIVKEIKSNHAIIPEVSVANVKEDLRVLVLYEVDKVAEHIQHLIKWIMDCYTDKCKFILCCEDDVGIIESVKDQCKVIKVDAPVTHEIMEVLTQIARKENFDLTTSFAAKIAAKAKQNVKRAIMALEACKAHNYPFSDEQPIPLGWEEVVAEIAAEILTDPSQKRLFFIRGKFQKLLVDFVHPKLILRKLVQHFLKAVDASIKRELYYWHAYYEKRLPIGTTALLKLEEFVAKFMSIYRRSSGGHQLP